MTVVRTCDQETVGRLLHTAERLKLPLVGVLSSLLLLRSQEG